MATIQSEREQHLTHIRNGVDELQRRFDELMQLSTHDDEMETLARVERGKKLVAEKGEALEAVMDEVSSMDDDDWDDARDRLDAVWQEYREAVERVELEFERADELR